MWCTVQLTEEEQNYLSSCARIRRISTSRLLMRLVTVIAHDQLVLSILDDNSQPAAKRLPGEESKSHHRSTPLRSFS